ncbi:MAG TPA: M13 family metallopeptidase N-terminal domain-containing protein, partial [Thermoanaerobaculia bacterium]|nr:M13 family metallopeptidase N-terminal domain-containing protein [Thermoanaerobaculia bacterium]
MRKSLPILLLLAACATQQSATQSTPASHGFDVANVDRSASACTDFYQYANGGWLKANPIPAAYSRWGNFNVVEKRNVDKMHTLLDEAAKANAPAGSTQQKV